MMKAYCLTLLLFMVAASCFASGTRDIGINACIDHECIEINLPDLPPTANYIGSTVKWHLFALALTSSDGDMPWSNIYGYKVDVSSVQLINNHTLMDEDIVKYADVQSCPKVLTVNLDKKFIDVEKIDDSVQWCLFD